MTLDKRIRHTKLLVAKRATPLNASHLPSTSNSGTRIRSGSTSYEGRRKSVFEQPKVNYHQHKEYEVNY